MNTLYPPYNRVRPIRVGSLLGRPIKATGAHKQLLSQSVIFALFQGILGLVIVVGCGVLLATTDIEPTALVGVAGVVVGYFFGSSVSPVARVQPDPTAFEGKE